MSVSNESNPPSPPTIEQVQASPIATEASPPPNPEAWVDPLLLSPLTPTSLSPQESPGWIDPLRDWDGTFSEIPNGWVDPLIAHPLDSNSPTSTSSPSSQPSDSPTPDSSLATATTSGKRKRVNPSSNSIHSMPGDQDPEAGTSTARDPRTEKKPSPIPKPTTSKNGQPKVPKDPAWVKERLKAYGLLQDDQNAPARYPSFVQRLETVLSRKRESDVTAQEFKEFRVAWHTYKDFNEDTVLNELLPYLIKSERSLPASQATAAAAADQGSSTTDKEVRLAALSEDEKFTSVSFLESGMVKISNREFARSFLPFRDDSAQLDSDIINAMQKQDGMTNPRPDRTYAVSVDKYKSPQGFWTPADIAVYLEIMRSCHHPFFIIEGKSYEGDLRDARNQACRGGAALVHSARLLRGILGEEDVVGADPRTFVFSATLSPGLLDIWAHWAEVPDAKDKSKPVYHMTLLRSKAIADQENFGQSRRILHNILDWGIGARFTELTSVYEAIVRYEAMKTAGAIEAGNKKRKTGSSKE
ncbi:MAG: hypothetical protein Q9201_002233 [Fulgogasparrea decipioides]